jgi:uncharacterized OB-fold protein
MPAGERPLPPESPAGAPFWAATRDERLVLPWCASCEVAHWYPRGFCPTCLGPDIEWRPSEGRGVVHAVSVQPKAAHPSLADRLPYAVALVDLDDGVRMLMAVAAEDPWAVRIGDAVTLGWEPLADGRNLPVAFHTD